MGARRTPVMPAYKVRRVARLRRMTFPGAAWFLSLTEGFPPLVFEDPGSPPVNVESVLGDFKALQPGELWVQSTDELQDGLDPLVEANLTEVVHRLRAALDLLRPIAELPGADFVQVIRTTLIELGLNITILLLHRAELRLEGSDLTRQPKGGDAHG